MPRMIAIETRADIAGGIDEAIGVLRSGGVVGVPDSTSYRGLTLAGSSERVAQLQDVGNGVCLAVNGDEQATDLAPELPESLKRLMKRCWPGPLVVRVGVQEGGFQALDRKVQATLLTNGHFSITSPGDPIVQEIMARMDEPLVVTGDTGDVGRVATANEVAGVIPVIELVLNSGPVTYDTSATVVQVTDTGFEVVFSGVLSDQAIRLSACRIYLFVCTGNTCRSPLAEGLFRNLLAERLQCEPDELIDMGFLVQSAGLAAASGSPASFESVDILKRRGIDIGGHSSQPLSAQLLDASDHIFTMTQGHRDAILRFRADLGGKVEVLRRNGEDVVDPIGGGMGEYERCEREIEESLRAIVSSHLDERS